MLTRDSAIELVKSFINELINKGIKLEKAFLFGSYAKNKQHIYSDIDLALVSNMFEGLGIIDKQLFSDINIKDEYMDIETQTYPIDYFEEGDPLIDEIKRTGIEIKIK